MKRRTNFTIYEDEAIKIGLANGKSVIVIAEFLGRTRAGVYKRIKAMRLNPSERANDEA